VQQDRRFAPVLLHITSKARAAGASQFHAQARFKAANSH